VSGARGPLEIQIAWMLDGQEKKVSSLIIKSSSYRTWSWKIPPQQPGKWTVTVRDYAGQVMASQAFEVKAPS
jgi:hypothetical protein